MRSHLLAAPALLGAVLGAAQTAPAGGRYERDRFADGSARLGPPLVRLRARSFEMGSRPEDPGYHLAQRRRRVELGPYAIGAFEVTNAEFAEFLNDAGNAGDLGIGWVLPESEHSLIREREGRFVPLAGAERRPVVTVSWRGARAYCRWLSRKTGAEYDLPSAAEWEAAARGGRDTAWAWGRADDPTRYRSRLLPGAAQTAPVGSYPANAFGLHDTAGNVWEWVRDCYRPDFPLYSPRRDPLMLDEECPAPEIRGGSFKNRGALVRPGYRANAWWWGEYDDIGFRVARRDAPVRRAAARAGRGR